MSEGKKRELQDINREISTCKGHISLTQGRIITSLTKYSTPNKESSPPNPQTASSSSKQSLSDEQEVVSYIKNINHLRDTLEQKAYVIQVQREKDRLVMQNQITRYKNSSAEMERLNKQNTDHINILKNQVVQLEKSVKEKQNMVAALNQELFNNRRQNTELKLQNKNLKADNKVIMSHIDRLTKEKKIEDKKDSLAEREVRVMKSLYLHTIPEVELKESVRRFQMTQELKNKVMLEQSTEGNSELKALIRRLNQQIELLKREKEALIQQNKQRSLYLQNQKMVVKLTEEENQKLNGVIHKMGDKMMNLEKINQTFKDTINKLQNKSEESDENYYRQTKAKAGQFYYRK